MTTKIITMYVHGSREDCAEKAEEIGLEGDAAKRFWYALEEFEVELEVNMDTGEAKLIKIDSKEVKWL